MNLSSSKNAVNSKINIMEKNSVYSAADCAFYPFPKGRVPLSHISPAHYKTAGTAKGL